MYRRRRFCSYFWCKRNTRS